MLFKTALQAFSATLSGSASCCRACNWFKKDRLVLTSRLKDMRRELQLAHKRSRWFVQLWLHTFPILRNQSGIHLVCFCPLALGLGKTLYLPRIHYRHLNPFFIQSDGQRQAVHPEPADQRPCIWGSA